MFPMTTAYPCTAGRHQRPFNHPPAEVSAEKKRRGDTHESLIRDSCCMLNYFTATMQVKAEEESITADRAQVLPLCESSTWLFPYSGS